MTHGHKTRQGADLLWETPTLNPIQDGGQKSPLPVFPLQLQQMQELAPQSFWRLVLTLSPHLHKISRPYLVPVPNY